MPNSRPRKESKPTRKRNHGFGGVLLRNDQLYGRGAYSSDLIVGSGQIFPNILNPDRLYYRLGTEKMFLDEYKEEKKWVDSAEALTTNYTAREFSPAGEFS